MAEARAQDPDNPLTPPCGTVITATEEYVRAAQRAGCVRQSVKGYDLFLVAVSVAWLKGAGAAEEESLDRVRALVVVGYRERNVEA